MLILTCLHLLNMGSDSRGVLIRANDVHLKCLLSPFPGIDWLPCPSDRGTGEEPTAQGTRSSAPQRAAISNRASFAYPTLYKCLQWVEKLKGIHGDAALLHLGIYSMDLPSQFLPNVRRRDLLMMLVLIAFSIGVLKNSYLCWTL